MKYLLVCNVLRGKWSIILLKITVILLIFVFLLHPDRFAKRYPHINDNDIKKHLSFAREPNFASCRFLPNSSNAVINNFHNELYDETEVAKELHVHLGGWWTPEDCEAVHDIAIIVPYRDRKGQLMIFLRYMHEFLQKQYISYRILVIEQAPSKPFNRGQLMNVGYKEARKLHAYPCFIFHDVDLLPQVLNNIYGCTKMPRHMSSSINVWRYNLLYHGAFGGATAILAQQFEKSNGFSNIYFGWGGEDDDLLVRIRKIGLDLIRFSPEISRYYMLPHKAEKKNPDRFKILNSAEIRTSDDGLNSIKYQVLVYRNAPLQTHIVVQL